MTSTEKRDAALKEYCSIIRELRPAISKKAKENITKLFDDLKTSDYTSLINNEIMENVLYTINGSILESQYTQRAFIYYIIAQDEIKGLLQKSISDYLSDNKETELLIITNDIVDDIFDRFNNLLSDSIRQSSESPTEPESSEPISNDKTPLPLPSPSAPPLPPPTNNSFLPPPPPSNPSLQQYNYNMKGGNEESREQNKCAEIAELFPKDESDENIRSDITTLYRHTVGDVLNSNEMKTYINNNIIRRIKSKQLNDTIYSFVLNKPYLNKSILSTLLNSEGDYTSPSIKQIFKATLHKALEDNREKIKNGQLNIDSFVLNIQESLLGKQPTKTLGGKRRTRRYTTTTTTATATRRKYNRRRARTLRNRVHK